MHLGRMRYLAAAALIAGLDHSAVSAQIVIGMDQDQRDQVTARAWDEGDRVLVNRRGDNLWYPGVVKGRRGPDYRISYADGQAGAASPVHIAARSFKPGDMIMIGYPVAFQRRTYRARILKVMANGIQARITSREHNRRVVFLPWARLKLETDELPAQPTPTPTPTPTPEPKPNVVVCNRNNDTVHFALKFYVADYANVQQGWWEVAPDACTRLNLAKLQTGLSGREPYGGGGLYIYGETEGILGGIIKQAWPRDFNGVDAQGRDLTKGCVGGSLDEAFLHVSREAREAGVERGYVECPPSSETVDMAELSQTNGVYRYTFEGWE